MGIHEGYSQCISTEADGLSGILEAKTEKKNCMEFHYKKSREKEKLTRTQGKKGQAER